ncbi:MAG: class I SAM-dependent methyltransferase [Candidatus Manganitrophaceae bacterium]|nr:MAG: class I SAM-dependent methyltransferase [Candidatus Manganitrophaceae bacterium]
MQFPPRNQERKKRKLNPKRETLASYTAAADLYLSAWDRRSYKIPPLLKEWQASLARGALVLDLGCGPGQDSRHLLREGFRPIGLDGTWPFLVRARRRARRLPLVSGDLERLPFQSDSFDAVWAAASLIHLPKDKLYSVLLALRDLTKPGGIFGATFAHGTGEGFLSRGWIPGRYFSCWKKEELAQALAETGWKTLLLKRVFNRERRGPWLNLIAVKS